MLVSSRRGFLVALGAALVAAPAVVAAQNLMPISAAKLWVPDRTLIGSIKPIVGPVPDGWIPCDGRWLGIGAHPELHSILGDKYGVAPGGAFCVPNLSERAASEHSDGIVVGRYVIYGGKAAEQHKRSLSDLMKTVGVTRDNSSPDKWATLDWLAERRRSP